MFRRILEGLKLLGGGNFYYVHMLIVSWGSGSGRVMSDLRGWVLSTCIVKKGFGRELVELY